MGDGKIFYVDSKQEEFKPIQIVPQPHCHPITCFSYNKSQDVFVSCDEDGIVFVWKFNSGKTECINEISLKNSGGGVPSLLYFIDGQFFVVAKEKQESKIFKISNYLSLNSVVVDLFFSCQGSINSICLNSKNFWISVDSQIQIFNSAVPLNQISSIASPHRDSRVVSILDHKDIIFSFGEDGSIRIWNPKSFESLKIIERHDDKIIFATSYKDHIHSISKSGEIIKWYFQFD